MGLGLPHMHFAWGQHESHAGAQAPYPSYAGATHWLGTLSSLQKPQCPVESSHLKLSLSSCDHPHTVGAWWQEQVNMTSDLVWAAAKEQRQG